MDRLGALGVQAQITEMNVRLQDGSGTMDQRLTAQTQAYGDIATVCRRSRACTSVTTWGVTDRYTWTLKPQREPDAPLLFDTSYRAKPAYYAVKATLA
jgi:endo-1,4-beta-xylanase